LEENKKWSTKGSKLLKSNQQILAAVVVAVAVVVVVVVVELCVSESVFLVRIQNMCV